MCSLSTGTPGSSAAGRPWTSGNAALECFTPPMSSFSSVSDIKTILGAPPSVGEVDELCPGTRGQLEVPEEGIDQMGPHSPQSPKRIIYFFF